MVFDPFEALKPQVVPDAPKPKPEPEPKCDFDEDKKILGIDEKIFMGIIIGFIIAYLIQEM